MCHRVFLLIWRWSVSITGFIIAVLRFIQLKPRLEKAWLNVGSLAAFSIGCFGLTLVGNFQVSTDR